MKLGSLPGETTGYAQGVSSDGSTVVGFSSGVGIDDAATRWTTATGITDLGVLPGGTRPTSGFHVSADGQIAVGYATDSAGRVAFSLE